MTNGLVVCTIWTTFVGEMNNERKETLRVRLISIAFTVLALAVFKPFGLQARQWETYVHLLAIWGLGLGVCLLTEGILKYIINKPRSLEQGVDYIISRNLWFQLINTPLIALAICVYRHFVLSDRLPGNSLSISNFLETLLIIAFCSFAIGLYWRFKFRSRYLAAELEETRLLNERLQQLQQVTEKRAQAAAAASTDEPTLPESGSTPPSGITLTGTTSETVSLLIADLLYVEAVGNYVKVYHLQDGQVRADMLRATSKQMEEDLRDYPMIVRCHRAFLVNLAQVEQIVSRAGAMQLVIKHCNESLPVSRSHAAQVKAAIN